VVGGVGQTWDIDAVVEGAPVVVVVGARKDGLAIRESVLNFILPWVPAAVVDRQASRSFAFVRILPSTH
jgi:hypothetical protein